MLIKTTQIGEKRVWNPVQSGMQLSTTVTLELSELLMNRYKLQYFLTSRLSQDSVENLFSKARSRGVMRPTCTVFRQALRITTVAQFPRVPKASSYEEDGCSYLFDYLKERDISFACLEDKCQSSSDDCNNQTAWPVILDIVTGTVAIEKMSDGIRMLTGINDTATDNGVFVTLDQIYEETVSSV